MANRRAAQKICICRALGLALDIYTDMLVMNLGSMVDPALFKELCKKCRVIQKDVPRWMICDYYKTELKN